MIAVGNDWKVFALRQEDASVAGEGFPQHIERGDYKQISMRKQ